MKKEKEQTIPQKYKKIKRKYYTVICWQIRKPTRNGWVSRNIQPAKIESRKNLNRPMTRSEIESVKKKPPCKPKSRTTWLHWGILPNIQRRTYTYPSQTLPKDWRGGNTSKVILWSHHHPDKARQSQTKTVEKKKITDQYHSWI